MIETILVFSLMTYLASNTAEAANVVKEIIAHILYMLPRPEKLIDIWNHILESVFTMLCIKIELYVEKAFSIYDMKPTYVEM